MLFSELFTLILSYFTSVYQQQMTPGLNGLGINEKRSSSSSTSFAFAFKSARLSMQIWKSGLPRIQNDTFNIKL